MLNSLSFMVNIIAQVQSNTSIPFLETPPPKKKKTVGLDNIHATKINNKNTIKITKNNPNMCQKSV